MQGFPNRRQALSCKGEESKGHTQLRQHACGRGHDTGAARAEVLLLCVHTAGRRGRRGVRYTLDHGAFAWLNARDTTGLVEEAAVCIRGRAARWCADARQGHAEVRRARETITARGQRWSVSHINETQTWSLGMFPGSGLM